MLCFLFLVFVEQMWNYVYLIAHLQVRALIRLFRLPFPAFSTQLTPETEHKGQESYIWEKYKLEQIDWFPMERSMVLDQHKSRLQRRRTKEVINRSTVQGFKCSKHGLMDSDSILCVDRSLLPLSCVLAVNEPRQRSISNTINT